MRSRRLADALAFVVCVVVATWLLLLLGVAVGGIHICGDEIAMAGQLLRHDVGVVVVQMFNTLKGRI